MGDLAGNLVESGTEVADVIVGEEEGRAGEQTERGGDRRHCGSQDA
ncbi:MAG TPA: hypothetical protein VGF71_16945 [Caulobacteraceae bacterium]|jgi:hypothetical protein